MASPDPNKCRQCGSAVSADGKAVPSSLLAALNAQRSEEAFCDVVLHVQDRSFNAHKCVLAGSSQYFRAMFEEGRFCEGQRSEATLHGISPVAMEPLLNMVYTGVPCWEGVHVLAVLAAADHLMLWDLKQQCEDYLQKLLLGDRQKQEVAIQTWRSRSRVPATAASAAAGSVAVLNKHVTNLTISAIHVWRKLRAVLFPFNNRIMELAIAAISNLLDFVAETEAFLDLSVEDLCDLLSKDEIQGPGWKEQTLWEAAVRWLEHDVARRVHTDAVMATVRFPLIDSHFLATRIDGHALMSSEECLRMVREAMLYQLDPEGQSMNQSPQTRPRGEEKQTIIYCLVGLKRFMCYLPKADAWYSLQAPHSLPVPEPQSSSTSTAMPKDQASFKDEIVVVNETVYAYTISVTQDGQNTGQPRVCLLQRYDMKDNTWRQCSLPRCKLGCFLIECQHVLYACADQGLEAYSADSDSWTVKLVSAFARFTFAISEKKKIICFDRDAGKVLLIDTSTFTTSTHEIAPLTGRRIISVSRMSGTEVLLAVTSSSGILLPVLLSSKPPTWMPTPGRTLKDIVCYASTHLDHTPQCLNRAHKYKVVYDQYTNSRFMLGTVPSFHDVSKPNVHQNARETPPRDGVLPFFEILNNGKNWKRLSCLSEKILLGGTVQLCVRNGAPSMSTVLC